MGDYLKGSTWSEVYQSILGVGAAADHAGLTASEKDVWTDDGAGSKTLAAFQLSSDTLLMRSTNNLAFGDLGTYINQSGDGVLNVSSDGSIVFDAATAINLDSDSGVFDFKDDGTSLLQLTGSSSDVVFQPQVLNKDIIFKEDGGTEIARFDSSAESLLMASGKKIEFADTGEYITGDGTDLTIASGGDINLTAVGDINIPSSVGVTFGSDNQKIEGDGTDLNVSATGSIILASSEATGDAIKLNASNVAGGIDIDAGTGGIDILSVNQIDIDTSGAGQDINIDAQAGSVLVDAGEQVADAIKIYASGSHANTTLNLTSAGTGVSAIDINSSGGIDIDAANDVNIDTTDTSQGIKIGTATSGVPIAIGHGTSEVSFGDNISVAGDCAVTGTLSSGSYAPDAINLTHATDPILTIYNTEQLNGDGDRHGKLIYKGVKLDSTAHQLAYIISQHDGTGNDLKGETIFYVNDGSDTDDNLSEWLRGDSSLKATFAGDASLAATKKMYLDGGSNTYIHEPAADDLTMVAGGNTAMILDADSYVSLSNNDSGTSNTLFGKDAGKNLDAGSNYNVFIGDSCADATLNSAVNNTSIGYQSLTGLTSGDNNTAVGNGSGYSITSGSQNTLIGHGAGQYLISGERNTFVGNGSGIDCETGTYSTYIGVNTEVSADGVTNETAIGYGAVGQGANTIILGNSSVTGLLCYDTTISSPSDERIKREVKNADYGLNLINALRPITYKRINPADYPTEIKPKVYKGEDAEERPEENNTIYAGLIAQEVEEAMVNAGLDFKLVTTTPNGMKALGYGALVMPLIKAVQELTARLETVENK